MRALLFVTLLFVPMLCLAIPTGLNMMPTAEALGLGSTCTAYESAGSGKLDVPPGASVYGAQVGLILGIEGGIDHVAGGEIYNAKWVFISDGLIFPALGVGIQNFGSGDKSQYYLVATKSLIPLVGKSLGDLKLHAGVMHDTAGSNSLMYGVSGGFGPLIVKADRVTSNHLIYQQDGQPLRRDGESLSTGVVISSLTLTGTYYKFTDGTDTKTVTLSYLFKAL
jgi:hypothetical protein